MTSRSAWLALSLTIVTLGAPGVAAAADAARGAKLGYTCQGCHGIPNYQNSFPIYHVPKLGGQHTAYMVVALKEYASQDRPHPGRAVGTAPKAGQTCVACHGNDGIGIMPEYPNLAGQHADYIEHSLKAYRDGQRKNAVMGGMAAALTDKDIRELAAYYSSQRPGLCATNETSKKGKCAGL
jgi:cytochrome c553